MRPIFVGGCPRSGTTLLGAMLGSHARIICVPESEFIGEAIAGEEATNANADLSAILFTIGHHWRFKFWDLSLDKASILEGGAVRDCPQLILAIVREYARARGKACADMWVDHTPNNTQYLQDLLGAFPDAKGIHIIRDGRAVAASIMPLDWGPNEIDQSVDLWISEVATGLAAQFWAGNDRVMIVRYEDLVESPNETLLGLCTFLDIEFDPRMTQGTGFVVPAYARNQHRLVGQAPNRNRINAWQHKLTKRQVEIFETGASSLLRYLGYRLVCQGSIRSLSLGEQLLFHMRDLFWRKRKNRLRLYLRRNGGLHHRTLDLWRRLSSLARRRRIQS